MKIRNPQIATLVKKLKQPHSGLRSPQIMHPVREWFVGLLVAILILAAAAAWGAATYTSYRDVSMQEQPEEVSAAVYRELQVEQALTDLRERDSEHKALSDISGVQSVPRGSEVVLPEEESELKQTASTSNEVLATTTADSTVVTDEDSTTVDTATTSPVFLSQ